MNEKEKIEEAARIAGIERKISCMVREYVRVLREEDRELYEGLQEIELLCDINNEYLQIHPDLDDCPVHWWNGDWCSNETDDAIDPTGLIPYELIESVEIEGERRLMFLSDLKHEIDDYWSDKEKDRMLKG